MSDTAKLVLILAAGLLLLTFTATSRRGPHTLLILLLGTMAVFPQQITSSGNQPYAGLSQVRPTISTYTIIIVVAIIALSFRGLVARSTWFIPFLLFTGFGFLLLWPWNTFTQAGAIQLLLGVLGWLLGVSFARSVRREPSMQRLLLFAILLIVLIQLAVSALQLAGLNLFPLPPDIAAIMGDRVHGTLNHPNNLGKALILLSALALPFLDGPDLTARRSALTIVLGSGIGVALTQGRANIIAFVLILAIRLLLGRDKSSKQRRAAILLIGIFSIAPVLPEIAVRFAEDPSGGSRSHLLDLAFEQFARTPWWGIGPNQYIHVVGQYDKLTADGLPVHSSYILLLVELGLIGCIVFFLPMLTSLLYSVRMLTRMGTPNRYAASSVALGLGFIIVAATGWGAVSGSILPLWLFALGFLLPVPAPALPTSFDQHSHIVLENA